MKFFPKPAAKILIRQYKRKQTALTLAEVITICTILGIITTISVPILIKAIRKDNIRLFNNVRANSSCVSQIGDVCIVSKAKMADMSLAEEIKAANLTYRLPKTSNGDSDFWQTAKYYCEKIAGGQLPSSEQLTAIARILYEDKSITNGYKGNLNWETNNDFVFTSLGLTKRWFTLWSSEPYGEGNAYSRSFADNYTENYATKRDSVKYVVCVL